MEIQAISTVSLPWEVGERRVCGWCCQLQDASAVKLVLVGLGLGCVAGNRSCSLGGL